MNRDDINKLADWMIANGYATGHGETMEDLLAELDWQIAENWNRAMINGITTEREACAKICDSALSDEIEDEAYYIIKDVAASIRDREQLINGMTEEETDQTMSVKGLK